MDEKLSIRESAKFLKKYGSTNNHKKCTEHYMKHIISKTDTLQGIALKYGVTTEQIRRANHLWANDSLFLRETLLVPIPSSSPSEGMSSPSDVSLAESLSSNGVPNNNNNGDSIVETDNSFNEFFCKIDCSIANTRSQVMLAQGNSGFQDEDALFVRRKPMSRLRQHQVGAGAGEVPLVVTQGRRVRSSLQHLEQRQDELFEL